MTRPEKTLPASYFDEKYKSDIDPWRFRTSPYEKEKYGATLGALSRPRYHRGLEVGCSIGVLTAMLAARCETLVAIDASPTAVAAAKQNCIACANVSFDVRTLPQQFPEGGFDLIVLSEVLYYFNAADLDRVARKCLHALVPDGAFLLCHWLGETDYPMSGAEASDRFAKSVSSAFPHRTILHDDVYRLERLTRRP